MPETSPIPYFILFCLVMMVIGLLVRLSDAVGHIHEIKEKIRILKGEKPEEEPEWF